MIQADGAASAGGVDETSFADVNAHVADVAAAAKEHQIGRRQLPRCDARALYLGQLPGGARQAQIQHVPIHIRHQAAAVEA